MDLTISERLAVVETKVDTIHTSFAELKEAMSMTDGRVQVVCDYILAEKAKKSLATNALIALGGIIAAFGTLWEIAPKK